MVRPAILGLFFLSLLSQSLLEPNRRSHEDKGQTVNTDVYNLRPYLNRIVKRQTKGHGYPGERERGDTPDGPIMGGNNSTESRGPGERMGGGRDRVGPRGGGPPDGSSVQGPIRSNSTETRSPGGRTDGDRDREGPRGGRRNNTSEDCQENGSGRRHQRRGPQGRGGGLPGEYRGQGNNRLYGYVDNVREGLKLKEMAHDPGRKMSYGGRRGHMCSDPTSNQDSNEEIMLGRGQSRVRGGIRRNGGTSNNSPPTPRNDINN